jgi:uncharacterized lipoprotein YbaY
MQVIRGEIVFDRPVFIQGATVYIRILDVSRADALSSMAAESILPEINLGMQSEYKIPFSINCPPLNPKRSYSIEVHVDISGSGDLSSGDFISVESNPVSTMTTDTWFVVRVTQV